MSQGLVERVRRRLVERGADATAPDVASALRAEGLVLGDDAVLEIVGSLRQEMVGVGVLEPLVRDRSVTDVLVVGPREVWLDRGNGLERADICFGSADDVRRLAQRLAAQAGRRLDDAAPTIDARLPDGTRLHAVLPPVAVDSTLISLRVPQRTSFDIAGLQAAGSIDDVGAEALRSLVKERINFLVSGGTGSGKTTVLAALLGEVPADERLVIVEDSVELRPDHPHVARMQSRLPNAEGAGEVTLRDLVRQSLRMRPDRVVVGEVRGAEVVDLLLALNTGHDGCCGTVHANSAEDVPARLEALALTAGIDRAAVHALMGAGLEAVVHLERTSDGIRRLSAIHSMHRGMDGLVRTAPVLVRDGDRMRWVDRDPADLPALDAS